MQKLRPILEGISAGDVRRLIQDAVQIEVGETNANSAYFRTTASNSCFEEILFYAGIPQYFDYPPPVRHAPSSSPHQTGKQPARDGYLNLSPLGFPIPANSPPGTRPLLRPRDPTNPHLAPRTPSVITQENRYEDEECGGFPPGTLEECKVDAYNFDKTFRGRSITRFPQEQWGDAHPSRHAILTIRHHSRVKSAQEPADIQREIQWRSLTRRAQRASERCDVSLLYNLRTTLRAVGKKDYYNGWSKGVWVIRLAIPINRLFRRFSIRKQITTNKSNR